jgi:hypothetical protein
MLLVIKYLLLVKGATMTRQQQQTQYDSLMSEFILTHEIALYTPSTSDVYKQITKKAHTQRTDTIASVFSDWFGGATIEQVGGFYKANNGDKIKEPINKVYAGCTAEQLKERLADFFNLARAKAKAWGQESIMIELDGKKAFIS